VKLPEMSDIPTHIEDSSSFDKSVTKPPIFGNAHPAFGAGYSFSIRLVLDV
jgi:hypothetical protein